MTRLLRVLVTFALGGALVMSLTLGATTDPGSDGAGNTDRAELTQTAAVSTSGNTILAGHAYVDGGGSNCKVVMYTDSAGAPGTLVAVSSPLLTNSGIQQYDFTMSGSFNAGTYWIGVVMDNFTSSFRLSTSGGTILDLFDGFSYSSPPATAPAPNVSNSGWFGSGWIDYSTGGNTRMLLGVGGTAPPTELPPSHKF